MHHKRITEKAQKPISTAVSQQKKLWGAGGKGGGGGINQSRTGAAMGKGCTGRERDLDLCAKLTTIQKRRDGGHQGGDGGWAKEVRLGRWKKRKKKKKKKKQKGTQPGGGGENCVNLKGNTLGEEVLVKKHEFQERQGKKEGGLRVTPGKKQSNGGNLLRKREKGGKRKKMP